MPDPRSPTIISESDRFDALVDELERKIVDRYRADALPAPLAIVGIRTGGAHLARRLKARVDAAHFGLLDITLYRDDALSASNPAPLLLGSEITFDVDGTYLVLVDDVLYTGRTVRAALDAILDLGRPRAIRLAVLVDRGHKELPIAADAVGLHVETRFEDHVAVHFAESGESDRIEHLVERREKARE